MFEVDQIDNSSNWHLCFQSHLLIQKDKSEITGIFEQRHKKKTKNDVFHGNFFSLPLGEKYNSNQAQIYFFVSQVN